MPRSHELDPGTLPESVRTALEAAAEARVQYLRATSVVQSNTARSIEEHIRERLAGESMLSPKPEFSRYIDQRAREIAGLPKQPAQAIEDGA